jgi:ribosome biogenesis GTPase
MSRSSMPEAEPQAVQKIPGVVMRAHGKFYEVMERERDVIHLATLKGSLKQTRQKTDIVAVGDRVRITPLDDGEARIEYVEPRTSVLQRSARGDKRAQQVILANADQALFLFAIADPAPHRRMLDRFLVLAESTGLPAMVGVNKIDLLADEPLEAIRQARSVFGDYESIYPVHYLSATAGAGLSDLLMTLEGRLTVIAGPSGVGKSSLLNTFSPTAQQETAAISEATGKGRHTTTSAQIFRINPGTYLADTPGMRALAMAGVPRDALDGYFPEIAPLVGTCFYPNCQHLTEPGCAVLAAVARGDIATQRYESYASLRGNLDD